MQMHRRDSELVQNYGRFDGSLRKSSQLYMGANEVVFLLENSLKPGACWETEHLIPG